MSLKIDIQSICYSPPRPELKSDWIRRIIGLPPLSEMDPIIRDCQFTASPNEVVAIVGASGSGKTTLLRIIAGLETEYSGSVSYKGKIIEKPDKRIYLMPQAHTLLPWLTIEDNMKFNVDKDLSEMPGKLLETFGFQNKRNRYPSSLSGGERARVALMCAMCAEPEVLLLDEPFRGIDQIMSEVCQLDLLKWLDDTKTKELVILVSHNVQDAVFFADRVIVVSPGPLRVHSQIITTSVKNRRSRECSALESDVYDALMDCSIIH